MRNRNHLFPGGEADVRPSRVDGLRRGGGQQHIPRGVVHAPHPFLGLARMLAQPLPQHVHLGRKKETGWGRGTRSNKVYDRLGCGFPVSLEFPPLPGKPSSVFLVTEFV